MYANVYNHDCTAHVVGTPNIFCCLDTGLLFSDHFVLENVAILGFCSVLGRERNMFKRLKYVALAFRLEMNSNLVLTLF